jgi:prepilin-type processing-associated H-X9-DG protein
LKLETWSDAVEENLLGHLLKANNPATTREVERRLAGDPSAARDLERLRAALAPLEADRDEVDPPTDLWARTLARVAQHIVATEGPQTRPEDARTDELIRRSAMAVAAAEPIPSLADSIVPSPPPSDAAPPPARRRNVFAGLALSVAVLALAFPGAVHLRQQAQRTGCGDTMRQFYVAAANYSETNDGQFPKVGDGQPAATAAEALKVAGYLPADMRFTCPARPDEAGPASLGNYAYSLGFRDKNGELRAVDRRPETDFLPILADAPRRQYGHAVPVNHRRGQNVLFAGGHVRFCTTVHAGPNGDDIYRNALGRVAAGVHPMDSALGRPEELP